MKQQTGQFTRKLCFETTMGKGVTLGRPNVRGIFHACGSEIRGFDHKKYENARHPCKHAHSRVRILGETSDRPRIHLKFIEKNFALTFLCLHLVQMMTDSFPNN
jgi:hypothetical protein